MASARVSAKLYYMSLQLETSLGFWAVGYKNVLF